MKIRRDHSGYAMWLSARDTSKWATRPNNKWPCSNLTGNRLRLYVDSNGLRIVYMNNEYVTDVTFDMNEFCSLVADHLPADLQKYWPCWEK
jgi:hypothetical protein